MEQKLFTHKCEACRLGAAKVSNEEQQKLLKEIPSWMIVVKDNVMMLEKEYTFKNYKLAWAFSNKVSELAEGESHHPTILLEWGKVTVTWWTHVISGLHINDFICAAKIDKIM